MTREFAFVITALCLIAVVLSGILLFRRKKQEPVSGDLFVSLARGLSTIENLSRDIESIRNLFLVPRLRGGIGEVMLEELLKNWLPRTGYALQYSFSNGSRADAVIRTGEYLVAVDSKFPLESLKSFMEDPQAETLPAEVRRTFQKQIGDIASRYIRPEDGTLPFALMYIPSERVYYQVFAFGDSEDASKSGAQNTGLWAEALRRGVIPVSPGTLFLYLSTVAYGLRGFTLKENEKELLSIVLKLSEEVGSCIKAYQTAANHARNLARSMEDLAPRLSGLELIAERLKNIKPS